MRITGGFLRGRRLSGPIGRGVRPSSARLREALFSMVGQQLDGWSVLDAFGGSGLLALEALSRGASPVTVIERHRGNARAITRLAGELGVDLEVRCADAARALGQSRWDLVLLDPPYREDPDRWLRAAAPSVRRVLSIEFRATGRPPPVHPELTLHRHRVYGSSALAIYRARPEPGFEEPQVVLDDQLVVEHDG